MSRPNRFRIITRLSMVAICAAIFFSPARADHYVGPSLLPNGSTGLIQFRVDALRENNAESLVWQLVNQVEEELGAFSVRHVGLDVTQLNEITVLVPPARILQESQDAPIVAAFTFGNNFSPDDVLRRLPQGWASNAKGQHRYYRSPDNGVALTFVGTRTVVVGDPSTLAQWLTARRGTFGRDLISRFRGNIQQAHIFGVFDAGQVPPEMRSALPPNLVSLKEAQAVGFAVSAENNQLDLTLHLAFKGRSHAASARRTLQSLVKQGAAALTFVEAEFSAAVENRHASVEEGIQALASLAVTRYGQQELGRLEIEQNENTLSASSRIDGTMLFLTLAALGNSQMESQAEGKFKAIADELQ